LGQIKAVEEMVFSQDKVPKDDSLSFLANQGAAPTFKIGAVNFKIYISLGAFSFLGRGGVVKKFTKTSQ